ncbi:MAG: hypothetical protein HFI67_10135 [Lachnospiraceae bacterium]|jgi:hypothetical protein|nr:hypothetical protein [Lachnospiraceae bacterium]
MKKILIISPNYQEDRCYEWIEAANSTSPHKNILIFDYISPENPISENVTLYDCLEIKEMLCHIDLTDYEGIILIHGTEYIPFTSAALSLLLTHVKIPLVVISQNALLTQKANYHMECFNGAVCFILANPVPGVFNVIKNEWANTLDVHFGSRISQTTPFDFQYIDMYSGRYGEIVEYTFHFRHGSVNPTAKDLLSMPRPVSPMKKSANVTYIRAYRRMPYHYYNFSTSRPAAVFQELYDLPSILEHEGLNALASFAGHCRRCHVPLYLCPLVYEDVDYENVLEPVLKHGAVLIQNLTVFSAYAKLVYGYGDGHFQKYLDTNYVFEDLSEIK